MSENEQNTSPEANQESEIERLTGIITQERGKDPIGLNEKISAFGKQLQEKYPNYKNYRLFHVLAASTIPEGVECPKFDFPDEDSIVNFIESLDQVKKKKIK